MKQKKAKIGVIGLESITELFENVMGDSCEIIRLQNNHKYKPFDWFIRKLVIIKKILSCDIVMYIFPSENDNRIISMANLLGKKVVYEWCGTDVMNSIEAGFDKEKWDKGVDLHLTYAECLKDELAEVGIESKVFTIVPKIDMTPADMPEEHAVLLSIPDLTIERANFYGYEDMIKVIRRFPNLKFYITRSNRPELYEESNAVFMGSLNPEQMNELYNKISIVIRYPKHDGLSLLLMESTIKGKYMVYKFKHPFSYRVQNVDEICDAISEILKEKPKVNLEAAEYGKANYCIQKCRENALEWINELLKK